MALSDAAKAVQLSLNGVTGATEELLASVKQQRDAVALHGAVNTVAIFDKLIAALTVSAGELRADATIYAEADADH